MAVAIDVLDLTGIDRSDSIAPRPSSPTTCPRATSAARNTARSDSRCWPVNRHWRYALYASIALIRAAAANAGQPVPELARRLTNGKTPT